MKGWRGRYLSVSRRHGGSGRRMLKSRCFLIWIPILSKRGVLQTHCIRASTIYIQSAFSHTHRSQQINIGKGVSGTNLNGKLVHI